MRSAVANGADAVYFGLQEFNARHRATNFTLAELPKVMEYLHSHNVRGFLTFNILIFTEELPAALEHLKAARDAGVDAVIVQDLGIVRLIGRAVPGLAVHGSTQMTLTEPRGIDFVAALGAQRVVLARELSLDDIRKIREGTDTPVEVFVHGALCVSYSGQCLTSEALGGRSANRGQCAQACRLPYELIVDGAHREMGDVAYLLSPHDLAAHDLIGQLVEMGVASFKIEGRLKDAAYVAATSQTYRAAIDAAIGKKHFRITPQQQLDLDQSFSRGFSHGFLSGVNHQVLVTGAYSKKRGVRLGSIVDRTNRSLFLTMEHPTATLIPGDGIVFDSGGDQNEEIGGRIVAIRPGRVRGVMAKVVEIKLHDTDLDLIAPDSTVWKTADPVMTKRLEQSYARDLVARRVPITAHVAAYGGRSLELTLTDPAGRSVTLNSDEPLELAHKYPLTVELLREQLGRLGDTPFELRNVTLEGDKDSIGVMAPKSLLNDMRRRAVEALLAARKETAAPATEPATLDTLHTEISSAFPQPLTPNPQPLSLHVLCRTLDQLTAMLAWRNPVDGSPLSGVYCDFEDVRRYKEAVPLARAAGIPIALATLRIIKPSEHGLLNHIALCQPDALLVRHLSAISFYKEVAPNIPMIGDYALNVANEITAAIFLEQGLTRLTPSYDLSWKQMEAMLGRVDASRFEATIHQHMPMFHMEHCVFAHTMSNGADYRTCGRPCDTHTVSLRDRAGVDHALAPDVGCRNTVFNGTAQSAADYLPRMLAAGLRHFRIELLRDNAESSVALLDRYARLLAGQETPAESFRSLRVLHQLGVTRGTLDSE